MNVILWLQQKMCLFFLWAADLLDTSFVNYVMLMSLFGRLFNLYPSGSCTYERIDLENPFCTDEYTQYLYSVRKIWLRSPWDKEIYVRVVVANGVNFPLVQWIPHTTHTILYWLQFLWSKHSDRERQETCLSKGKKSWKEKALDTTRESRYTVILSCHLHLLSLVERKSLWTQCH